MDFLKIMVITTFATIWLAICMLPIAFLIENDYNSTISMILGTCISTVFLPSIGFYIFDKLYVALYEKSLFFNKKTINLRK